MSQAGLLHEAQLLKENLPGTSLLKQPAAAMAGQGGHTDCARQREQLLAYFTRVGLLGPVLRLFPPCALVSHAQGSSGVV